MSLASQDLGKYQTCIDLALIGWSRCVLWQEPLVLIVTASLRKNINTFTNKKNIGKEMAGIHIRVHVIKSVSASLCLKLPRFLPNVYNHIAEHLVPQILLFLSL